MHQVINILLQDWNTSPPPKTLRKYSPHPLLSPSPRSYSLYTSFILAINNLIVSFLTTESHGVNTEFHGLDDKQKQCNSVLTPCDSVVK